MTVVRNIFKNTLWFLSALGFKPTTVEGQEVDLVGLQRTHHLKYGPHVYNLWLFEDGHIASRESDTGKVQLQVNKMPELIKDEDDLEPVISLPPLNWHDDMQLKSIYRQKASQLRHVFEMLPILKFRKIPDFSKKKFGF